MSRLEIMGRVWIAPAVAGAAWFTGIAHAADADAGERGYAVCAACHGPQGEGNQALNAPRLAGQSDWYLVRQIRHYQQELRGYDPKDIFGKQMQPMAATLAGEKAIDDVVAYINTLR